MVIRDIFARVSELTCLVTILKDYETATSSDVSRYADYFNYMLDHQIYLAPSQFEAMFVSAAHTAEDIAQTCEVLRGYGR